MRRIKKKEVQRVLARAIQEGTEHRILEDQDEWFESCFDGGWGIFGERLQKAPAFMEAYPNDQRGPNLALLMRENARLRALQDLGLPLCARWSWRERPPMWGWPQGYELFGECLVCRDVLKDYLMDWEFSSPNVSNFLTRACAHLRGQEIDPEVLDVMVALELLAEPGEHL